MVKIGQKLEAVYPSQVQKATLLGVTNDSYYYSFLTTLSIRARAFSNQRISIISKAPGENSFPVRATRSGQRI